MAEKVSSAMRNPRVEGCAEDAVVEVSNTAEGIHECAVATLVEADGKGVDGEVAPILVVLQGAVFNDGFA